jgi:hypothetical protein
MGKILASNGPEQRARVLCHAQLPTAYAERRDSTPSILLHRLQAMNQLGTSMNTDQRFRSSLRIGILSMCLGGIMAAAPGVGFSETIANVEVMAVSPRTVAAAPDDVFDEVASGLNVVGIGEKVYMQPRAIHGFDLGGATWELIGRPTGSDADLSDTEGTLVTLVPDAAGLYLVELTPLDPLMQPTDPVVQRIYAGVWIGSGTFNTHDAPNTGIPSCANACCHSGSDQPRLNVVDRWLGTDHANKLQMHLQGMRGEEYDVSCLPCHTVGFKESAFNGGFDDIAVSIDYDLQNIIDLIHEAGQTGTDNWPQLPAELQRHASIQCESCHGPGSQHLGFILEDDHGIGGVNLSTNQCAQCHDTDLVFGDRFYQWNESSHPVTQDASDGHVTDNNTCRACHTGEGFVHGVIKKEPIPVLTQDEYHGITCSACHDPHGSEYPNSLRTANIATLPNGKVVSEAGTGGLCMNCHHSRVADPESTAVANSRGAHRGPQADMLQGTGMVAFGLPVVGNSAHTTIVEDTCTACHMAESNSQLVGGHTYAMRASTPGGDIINAENACATCHTGLDSTYDRTARGDYDGDGTVEGIQTEVKGLLALIRTGLLNLPGTTLGADGTISVTTAGFAAWNDDQKRAFYNYNFAINDGSYGIHNTSYVVQMLQRSYQGAYGHSILNDYPDIDLRGPVQPSTVVPPTPTPTPVPTVTPAPTPVPEYLAIASLVGVSPRDVAMDETGVFDTTASGLRSVGIGEKVFLEAEKIDNDVESYEWSILSRPNGSTANLSSTTGELVTFRPDVRGTYLIRLTPITTSRQVIDVFDLRLYASEWVGLGAFDESSQPRAPECATGFCHGGDNANGDLNVLEDYLKSSHAQVMQKHLNGEHGAYYDLGWLKYHTVGFNQDPQAVNKGFDDIAATLGFDISQIPALVADAAENGNDNFHLLPGQLRNRASVQCESCHGAGSQHPPNLTAIDKGIDGADLGTKQCAQCHDSTPEFMQGFHQWSNSSHPITADASQGSVTGNNTCRPCHTGEGFVAVHAKGTEIPQLPAEEYHSITCSACHDPHYSDQPHQLRVAGDFIIPAGAQLYSSGTGGICVRCHNSRIADAEATALSNSRGSHYGTQGDMLMGVGGVSFDLPFESENTHGVVVADTCAHCHMADGVGEPGDPNPPMVGLHTFAMRDTNGDVINAQNACGECHGGLDVYDRTARGDYDGDGTVEGVQSEIDGLLTMLRTGIIARMAGTSVTADGYINVTTGGFNALTNDQKRAIYNYNFVAKDGSRGIHNTSYTVQLLQRAYYGVYGRSIVVDYPEIDLRGPVQPPPEGASVWYIN